MEIDTKLVAQIQELAEELLRLLNVAAETVVEIEQDGVVQVKINVADEDKVGLLIGYHGATLYALQSILALMINQGREEWLRLCVDVNDYRQQRDSAVRSLANRSAEKARFLEEAVTLPPMNAFERRLVHLEISQLEDMESESIGEPPRRRVVVRPQS